MSEYTPPRLRLCCTYQVTSGEDPASIEVEFNDPNLSLNGALVGEVIAYLMRPPAAPDPDRGQPTALRTAEQTSRTRWVGPGTATNGMYATDGANDTTAIHLPITPPNGGSQ